MIPSTPEDWQRSTYLYRQKWTAGYAPERFLANQFAYNTPNILYVAGRYFGVEQTLPKHLSAMIQITAIVFACEQPADIGARRIAITNLAEKAVEIAATYDEKIGRPISAMSKFLMLRFPNNSFVYDTNARATLAALQNMKAGWLKELDKFFQHWKCHAHPMIQCLSGNVFHDNPAGAARVVDKFLWLRGREHPDAPIDDTPDNQLGPAIEEGATIWSALVNADRTQLPQNALN